MKKSDELRKILDGLKNETSSLVGYDPQPVPRFSAPPVQEAVPGRRSFAAVKEELKRSDKSSPSSFNMVWSENKETLLFGMLLSVMVSVLGIITSADFMAMVGAFGFLLFCSVSFVVFFRYAIVAASREKIPSELREKILLLEQKVDSISSLPGSSVSPTSSRKINELEQKVEELKIVVRTISRGGEKNR